MFKVFYYYEMEIIPTHQSGVKLFTILCTLNKININQKINYLIIIYFQYIFIFSLNKKF